MTTALTLWFVTTLLATVLVGLPVLHRLDRGR
jgi:hypothetical protein